VPTAEQFQASAVALLVSAHTLSAQAGDALHAVEQLAQVAHGATGWWNGPRADVAIGEVDQFVSQARPLAHPVIAIATRLQAVGGIAGQFASRVRVLDAQRMDAVSARWSMPVAVGDPLIDDGEWAIERIRGIDRQLAVIDVEWARQAGDAARFIDDVVASIGSLRSAIAARRLGAGSDLAVFAAIAMMTAGSHPLPGDIDAARIAAWWTSLGRDERLAMLRLLPGVIGNLDGIPLTDRAYGIRLYVDELLAAEASNGPAHTRLASFLGPDGRLDPTRSLVALDLSGDGRIAELFGDLRSATTVTVLVPGMGSTLANFRAGIASDAQRLAALSGPNHAVIAWTGYDAPAGAEQGLRALEVASPRQAQVGGAALQSFIAGVQSETRVPLTLIGHSYGSLTVGQALLSGAQVTNVVFIGSPGVGVDRIDQFPRGAADNFFAGEVRGDPVATLQQFGDAPTDPDFGAFVFDAGRGDSLNPLGRHSEYFEDGVAIDNLVTISTGGAPTSSSPTITERILEFDEDLSDGLHSGIDAMQRVHVPFVDRPLDQLVDVGQGGIERGRNLAATVVETGGHFVEDGVSNSVVWTAERGSDVLRGAGWVSDSFVSGVRGVFGR